ncbi:uncharacterized protein LOC120282234 isoform X2 [Dioscorea cayenensis subsp. rotundata]|uniref:Uncharacterized protein LOC120282234 isoform X2 n=1 Tax=Dioscorea cayennensis subsp. rotundata TaxID=55577 RepID=A0AB40CY33_DIOCR|nr:uncharacterized protein LOC120282234 isoform X2 [Dioscorea cayenensis subsp. rotundata]
MISSSAPLFVLFLFVFRVCLSDDSPSTGGLDSPMLALVRALGRSRPFGRCREASHVSTGDFEAKIQRDNDASSITDLSSSLQNEVTTNPFVNVYRALNDQKSMADRFERWIVEHGRHYKDESEKQLRFEIFKAKVAYIEYFNAGNHMYTLAINKFADLTKEEVTAQYTGFIPPDEDEDFGHIDSSSEDSSSEDESLV